MARTNRQAYIDHVAAILVQYDETDPSTPTVDQLALYAFDINAGAGWSFDARLPENQYVSAQDWTRIEGARLSHDDITAAINQAIATIYRNARRLSGR